MLGCYLERENITPELYAIPWFVAYMATKFVNTDNLLEFWEQIVQRNDQTFIFFFQVSFLIYHKKKIMAVDTAKLPETMTSLRVSSSKELEELII